MIDNVRKNTKTWMIYLSTINHLSIYRNHQNRRLKKFAGNSKKEKVKKLCLSLKIALNKLSVISLTVLFKIYKMRGLIASRPLIAENKPGLRGYIPIILREPSSQ